MYYIYCYTNRLNNKKYVGKTNNIDRRKKEHLSTALNKKSKDYNLLFHQKIREYGIENFIFEILDETPDSNEANELEIFWICELNSFVSDNAGYNLTRGGDGNSYSRLSEKEIVGIKELISSGVSYDEISKKHNISKTFISNINHGKFFFEEGLNYPLFRYRFHEDKYLELYNLLKDTNLTFSKISEETGLSVATIKKYNSGLLRSNESYDYPIRKLSSAQMKAKEIKNLLINSNFSLLEIEKKCQTSLRTIKRINLGESHNDETLNYPLRR